MYKRALCIGINNYPGSGSDLTGCVNDMTDWSNLFIRLGFDMVQAIQDSQATKKAIMKALAYGIQDVGAGGLCVVTFSGHGTWVPDKNGDESDGRDEALCPYDYSKNLILDDELYDVFNLASSKARVVMISDSCHSGTVARFASPMGTSKRKVRFLPPEVCLSGKKLKAAKQVELKDKELNEQWHSRARQTCLLLAGCKDIEYSYDACFNNRPNGAFTYAAMQSLKKTPKPTTYETWFKRIRTMLPSVSHPQTPQFSATAAQKKWKLWY